MHVLFRADSRTNPIKQGENVKRQPSGSVAQLSMCSHGKREALCSGPGRATIFSSPVTTLVCPFDVLSSISPYFNIFVDKLFSFAFNHQRHYTEKHIIIVKSLWNVSILFCFILFNKDFSVS